MNYIHTLHMRNFQPVIRENEVSLPKEVTPFHISFRGFINYFEIQKLEIQKLETKKETEKGEI